MMIMPVMKMDDRLHFCNVKALQLWKKTRTMSTWEELAFQTAVNKVKESF